MRPAAKSSGSACRRVLMLLRFGVGTATQARELMTVKTRSATVVQNDDSLMMMAMFVLVESNKQMMDLALCCEAVTF